MVRFPTLTNLRRRIRSPPQAQRRRGQRREAGASRQAEVDQRNGPILANEDAARLQVSVQHPYTVCEIQAQRNLLDDPDRLLHRNHSPPEDRAQTSLPQSTPRRCTGSRSVLPQA